MKVVVVVVALAALVVLAVVVVGQRGDDARRWREMRCEAAVARRAWLEKEWMSVLIGPAYRGRDAAITRVYAVLQDARKDMMRECEGA